MLISRSFGYRLPVSFIMYSKDKPYSSKEDNSCYKLRYYKEKISFVPSVDYKRFLLPVLCLSIFTLSLTSGFLIDLSSLITIQGTAIKIRIIRIFW